MNIPARQLRIRNTHRLIPSRYPSVGILDQIASPEDLEAIIELEAWTNDRISNELGIIHRIPQSEWVTGKPMASVIMAAFCHPQPGGGRFNDGNRGCWYAGFNLETAHAEVIFHRTAELAEIGVFNTYVQVRAYLADFNAAFCDIRPEGDEIRREFRPFYSRVSYKASQALAQRLLTEGSNGIVYRSVRDPTGTCIACFRPKQVKNVRAGVHFEYRWTGTSVPSLRRIP